MARDAQAATKLKKLAAICHRMGLVVRLVGEDTAMNYDKSGFASMVICQPDDEIANGLCNLVGIPSARPKRRVEAARECPWGICQRHHPNPIPGLLAGSTHEHQAVTALGAVPQALAKRRLLGHAEKPSSASCEALVLWHAQHRRIGADPIPEFCRRERATNPMVLVRHVPNGTPAQGKTSSLGARGAKSVGLELVAGSEVSGERTLGARPIKERSASASTTTTTRSATKRRRRHEGQAQAEPRQDREGSWRGPRCTVSAKGGHFGAMQLVAKIQARFQVPKGGGRATDPNWTERRLVPLAPETLTRLAGLAKTLRDQKGIVITPLQLAALLLEQAAGQVDGGSAEKLVREHVGHRKSA